MATQREWPRVRDPARGFVLVPGIREGVGRSFAGPLRPGISGVAGARGGAVADDTRSTDLGMDRLRCAVDAIGQKYPETDSPSPLLAEGRGNGRGFTGTGRSPGRRR